MRMQSSIRCGALAALLASTFLAGAADAAVVISSDQTTNMNCSGGVCAPTAASAVLNVGDLENLLASGNVTVTTTGTGVQAADIKVTDSLGWSNANTLTLDAYKSITVDAAVSVAGAGGLSLTTNDGGADGTLSFANKGQVTFANLSSPLTVNGASYTLVDSVKSLANAIAGNPSGNYALAANYDASQDGTYSTAPIRAGFSGFFEGLGNTISKLVVTDHKPKDYVGLFAVVVGTVENLALAEANIVGHSRGRPKYQTVGGLVGVSSGTLRGDTVSGHVEGGRLATVGGLAGVVTGGTITSSHASALVEGGKNAIMGGLVGNQVQESIIVDSYATGDVRVLVRNTKGRATAIAGGLVGNAVGTIEESFATGKVIGRYSTLGGFAAGGGGESATISNCYSTGAVTGGAHSLVGGFIGESEYSNQFAGPIATSYSTGPVSARTGGVVGGFAGWVVYGDGAADDYWDTTTSGTKLGVGDGEAIGITGLTSAQLQSGLPNGFDKKIWGQSANINNGLPYLLANPPPK